MDANAYQISCTHLTWIIDLCQETDFHMARITKASGKDIEYLRNEKNTLTWKEYSDILSALSKFFDNVDMHQAGERIWNLPPYDSYASIGRVLFSTVDQYTELYGRIGYLSRNFPIDCSVAQTSNRRLTIRLIMRDGAGASPPFYSMILGQMKTLPVALGLPAASITMKTVDKGAVFTVDLNSNLLISTFTRVYHWFMASRLITREFLVLKEAYEQLTREHTEALASSRRAQMQITEHEANNRLFGSNIENIIWTMDRRLNKAIVAPTIETILGYTPEDFRELDYHELMSAEDYQLFSQTCKEVADSGQNYPAILQLRVNHGKTGKKWLELKILAHHRPGNLICIGRDISEAKMIENELASRITNYRMVTDSAMDGIVTFDSANVITYVNPAAADIFGYDSAELTGLGIREIMPEALGDIRLRELYRSTGELSYSRLSLQGLRKNKSLVALEASFASHSQAETSLRTCIIRDISGRAEVEKERESLQFQLEAAQKMDSIGQLSGGIAHDFNNLLVAILGYADLAIQSDTRESLDNYLEEIRKAGERGTDMTQKLLAFSRRQIIEPTMIEADDLIAGVQDMLSRLLPTSIEIVFENHASGARLLADITQLEQVLINLAVNARDAMPGGGTLRISIAPGKLESREGEQLVLQVSDTGTGMDAEIQKRIFEPFYTTKPEGRGTGLGLAVVFGIVNQHQGFIQVDSELGQGTTFTVYLPITDATSTDGQVGNVPDVTGGNETILVIEDDEHVRNLARLILTGTGYKVIEAGDGSKGVEVFQNTDRIDLVLMDIVMPVMGGREAAERIRLMNPDTPIVFTTGYSPDSVHTQFIREENLPFIQKPYGTSLLRQQIRNALDEDHEAAPLQDDSSVTFG